MAKFTLTEPALIAAMRKYADWADVYDRQQPEWLFVHTRQSDGFQTSWMLGETLSTVATMLEQNELSHFKLMHIEKVMGKEWVENIMKVNS